MIEEFIINWAVGVVLMVVKNEEKRTRLRSALLKIFRSIRAGFPGDPDFQ